LYDLSGKIKLQAKQRESQFLKFRKPELPEIIMLELIKLQVMFKQHENTGRISEKPDLEAPYPGLVKIQCLPLFSILSALNQTIIDYLSLDVEGSELEVLKTIPFKSLDIKVKNYIQLFYPRSFILILSKLFILNYLGNVCRIHP